MIQTCGLGYVAMLGTSCVLLFSSAKGRWAFNRPIKSTMINQFSTEATAVVFETLANKPDVYDHMSVLVKATPARAAAEIRSFSKRYVELSMSALGNDLAVKLIDTAFRDVRWEEIRNAFQREAA